MERIYFNPLTPNRLFYLESLDRSISNKMGVLLIAFIIKTFFKKSCI